MMMMTTKRILRTIVVAATLTTLVAGGACVKKPATVPGGPPVDPKIALLANADDLLFSLNEAKPIICSLVPVACPGLTQGLAIAVKIKDAIALNNNPGAIAFISELIPVIGQIVDQDINKLTAAQKTTIMAALALANIGLHYLSKHLASAEAAVGTRDRNASVLARFNAEPVWGESYKH